MVVKNASNRRNGRVTNSGDGYSNTNNNRSHYASSSSSLKTSSHNSSNSMHAHKNRSTVGPAQSSSSFWHSAANVHVVAVNHHHNNSSATPQVLARSIEEELRDASSASPPLLRSQTNSARFDHAAGHMAGGSSSGRAHGDGVASRGNSTALVETVLTDRSSEGHKRPRSHSWEPLRQPSPQRRRGEPKQGGKGEQTCGFRYLRVPSKKEMGIPSHAWPSSPSDAPLSIHTDKDEDDEVSVIVSDVGGEEEQDGEHSSEAHMTSPTPPPPPARRHTVLTATPAFIKKEKLARARVKASPTAGGMSVGATPARSTLMRGFSHLRESLSMIVGSATTIAAGEAARRGATNTSVVASVSSPWALSTIAAASPHRYYSEERGACYGMPSGRASESEGVASSRPSQSLSTSGSHAPPSALQATQRGSEKSSSHSLDFLSGPAPKERTSTTCRRGGVKSGRNESDHHSVSSAGSSGSNASTRDVRFATLSSLNGSLSQIVSSSRSSVRSSLPPVVAVAAAAATTATAAAAGFGGMPVCGQPRHMSGRESTSTLLEPDVSPILRRGARHTHQHQQRQQHPHDELRVNTRGGYTVHPATAATIASAPTRPPPKTRVPRDPFTIELAAYSNGPPYNTTQGGDLLSARGSRSRLGGGRSYKSHQLPPVAAVPPEPDDAGVWRGARNGKMPRMCRSITVFMLTLVSMIVVGSLAVPLLSSTDGGFDLVNAYGAGWFVLSDGADGLARHYANPVSELQALYQVPAASLSSEEVTKLYRRVLSEGVERLERATLHLAPRRERRQPLWHDRYDEGEAAAFHTTHAERIAYYSQMVYAHMTIHHYALLYARSRDESTLRRWVWYPLYDAWTLGINRNVGQFIEAADTARTTVPGSSSNGRHRATGSENRDVGGTLLASLKTLLSPRSWSLTEIADRALTTIACLSQSERLYCPSVRFVELAMVAAALPDMAYTDVNADLEPPERRRMRALRADMLRRDWDSEVYLETLLTFVRSRTQRTTREK